MEFANQIERLSLDQESEVGDYLFKVLSTNQIVQLMTDYMKEVNIVAGLPVTITRIFPNRFRWDQEKMMKRFFSVDQENFFKEAHIVRPFKFSTNRASQSFRKRGSTNETEDCESCFESLPMNRMDGLDCGHRFCTACWDEYLTTKIMRGGVDQTITCVAQNCEFLVDDESVLQLIETPRMKLKYQHLITKSFVECNKLLRWCPSPDCYNAINVHYPESRSVTCKCGHTFCSLCGQNVHDPIKCELLERWIKECNENLASCNWIAKNTKDCPKCDCTIQKDGGSNYMVCEKGDCKYEFCWHCLGSWDSHDPLETNCKRFSGSKDIEDQFRTAIDNRFLYYSKCYMKHREALKFEQKLYASVQVKNAVNILCLCRQTLMHTYILSYYLIKNTEASIFKYGQQNLESATECLSEYLKRDITSENLA